MNNKTEIADLQSLKELAEDAAKIYGDSWDSALVGDVELGNYHAIMSEKTEDVVVRANDDSRHSSWLCDYLEAVAPKKIIELIDRLEAVEAKLERQKPVAYRWESLSTGKICYDGIKPMGIDSQPLFTSPEIKKD